MGASPEKQVPNREKTQFKKGQSGNPKGRPKKEFSITDAIRAELEKPGAIQEFAESLVANAKNGNAQALAQILDRLDGPRTQKVDQQVTVKLEGDSYCDPDSEAEDAP